MTERLHSLDFLRAFALLMGVLLHILMLFLEPFDGSEPRLGASIIFIWIHTWRMPLFMLLAGFFTALSLLKRNTGNYAFNRLIRLGVPLLLLWSVIPAIDEEASKLFRVPELIYWLFYDVPFTFRLDHLWFLYYLLIFYSVLLLVKTAVPSIYSFILGFELSLSRVLVFWLPILILLSPLNKPTGGILGNDPVIFGEINLGSMLFMASFFMIGMQAYKSSQFLENLQRIRFWLPSLIVFSLIPIGLLAWGGVKDEPFVFSGLLELWIVNSLSGSAALFLVLSIMGLAMHKISSSGQILRWLVKLSYPIYVFHLMFVISVSVTLMFFGINDWIVVLLGFASGILFPVIIYYAFISWTPLDWVFNGYKNSQYRSKSTLMDRLVRYL
ncbi:MAG: acyltransferase family protein [Amylibacter sp.]|nr:acyltransferase family protein [Amylibacter sp.]